MKGGMWTELGAKIKNDAIVMIMHITHIKTNPPIMIPIHAMGRPDSLCLWIRFKEIAPNVSARIPSRRLVGKQMKPVNGRGAKPVQNDRMVKIPNTKLRMEWLLIGGLITSSFISIKRGGVVVLD
jgi:hypothetical protein